MEEAGSICLGMVQVPLIALMTEQVASLITARGLSAVCVRSECSSEQLRDISEGNYKIVFGTHEALLNSHRDIFRGSLKKNLKAVFIGIL